MSQFRITDLPKNAKDPFAKATFDKELNDRLSGRTFPYQRLTSLCGPAAFFYCLQTKKPAFYRRVATQLYNTGDAQVARLRITPKPACKQPKNFFDADGTPRISGLDWITLASLRSSSNIKYTAYDSPTETILDMASAITTPPQLGQWFILAGFVKVDTIMDPNRNNLIKLNNYVKQGYCVVALMSGACLNNQSFKVMPKPTHWVVWSSQLTDKNGTPISANTKGGDVVKLTVFSWGKNNYPLKPTITLSQFINHHFQFYVFR